MRRPSCVPSQRYLSGRRLLSCAGLTCARLAGACLARGGLAGPDAGDLHLRVLLPVALAPTAAGLVLEVDHVDLRAGCGAHDLGGDLVTAQFRAIADHGLPVHDE